MTWAGSHALYHKGHVFLENCVYLQRCVAVGLIQKFLSDSSYRLKKKWNFRVRTKFKEVNMEYLCNTNVDIDKNVFFYML